MAPDLKRNKDAEEARLRALQMADLGTARREYISTADNTRQRVVAMDEIERHRHSNIAGTAEQRRAQQNQASLSAWTNFYRTANTGRTEQLDDLMNGQSHRAQLNAALHGNEAARQPAGRHARARSFSHVPTHHHHHPYAHPSSGRGGGVVGTRSRHPGSPIRNGTQVGAHFQVFREPARRDPALDSNNPNDPTSRPTRGRGRHRRHSSRDSYVAHRARLPDIRPRRPAPVPTENYARRLTNPADFMANARASFPLPAVSSVASSSLPPKPPTAPKAMGPKPATNPKTVQKSSLDDSMFATPASSTPVASAADFFPGLSTPSRRIVPLEKTAGFSSRANAARPKLSDEPKTSDEPKPIDERQREEESEGPATVLLNIDQDEEANAETETRIRDLLLSPGMAELTGITFPTEDETALLPGADTQEHVARQLVQLIGNCSGYIQDREGSSQAAHPLAERLGPLTATSLVVIEAIAKRVVDEWSQQQLAAFRPPEAEVTPGPSTPTPSQDQRLALPNTGSIAPELETDQAGKTSIFENYRTPPRSASVTVTDSSDEKKQRNIDAASLLSPKKRVVSSDLPAMEFESLRVSEGGTISKAPQRAPVSQTIVRSEGPSRSVSEAQRPTLVQSSSNVRKETSVKVASPTAGPSAPQAPRVIRSRVLSGGIEQSIWADAGPSRFAPSSQPQAQPQQRPRTELISSRHSSTEDSTKSKVTFLGPAPYMPKRK